MFDKDKIKVLFRKAYKDLTKRKYIDDLDVER
jgi:hypothetical protein